MLSSYLPIRNAWYSDMCSRDAKGRITRARAQGYLPTYPEGYQAHLGPPNAIVQDVPGTDLGSVSCASSWSGQTSITEYLVFTQQCAYQINCIAWLIGFCRVEYERMMAVVAYPLSFGLFRLIRSSP